MTMQNHSSYRKSFENLKEEISSGLENAAELDRYLSLIHYSDAAVRELVEYFDSYPEPVILVFFGDHQPGLEVTGPVLEAEGHSPDRLGDEDYRRLYQVPFFILGNSRTREDRNLELSANYLGNLVLKEMGISLPPFRQFLEKQRQSMPSLSTQGTVNAEGEKLSLKQSDALLMDYRILQYDILFGGRS